MRSKVFVGVIGLVFASSLAAALPAAAQGPPDPPGETPQVQTTATGVGYAVIDTRRVVAESEIGRGITERSEVAAAVWEDRVARGRQGLAALAQRRAEQALTLNESGLAALNAEIDKKNLELQRLEEDARRDLANLSQELMLELNTAIGPSLERFAQERGFLLIFDSTTAAETGLLYWASEVDVTGDFIIRINGDLAQWRDVRNDDGLLLGSARVPGSQWLRESMFENALRRPRR